MTDTTIPAAQAADRRRGARGGRPRAAQRACSRRAPRSPRSSGVLGAPRPRPRLRRGELGHLGPAPRPARRRGGGRATRSSSRRSRSRRRRTRWRSPARRRCSRHRARRLLPRPGRRGGRGHRAHGRDHAGAPLRAPGRRWTSSSAIAAEHGLQIFEDAAQAHGASLDGHARSAPSAVRDVQPLPDEEHDLGRGRDGRRCANDEVARLVRLLRNQGMEQQLRERGRRLQHPDDRHPRRDRPGAADQGRRLDQAAPGERGVPRREPAGASIIPPVAAGRVHVYHQYTVRGPARTATGSPRALQQEYGVGSGVFYPMPNHRLPPFAQARTLDLPETERAAARGALAAGAPVAVPGRPRAHRRAAVNALAKAGA